MLFILAENFLTLKFGSLDDACKMEQVYHQACDQIAH